MFSWVQKNSPHIEISVATLNQKAMEEQLAHGRLDCILTNNPQVFSQAQQIFRAKETLILLAPGFCKYIEYIQNIPIIVNSIKSCPYREGLLHWLFLHHSIVPQIIELDTVEAIIRTVSLGGGVSLLPKRTLVHEQKINQFYIEELQNTSLSMWIPQNKFPSEYLTLKTMIEKASAN